MEYQYCIEKNEISSLIQVPSFHELYVNILEVVISTHEKRVKKYKYFNGDFNNLPVLSIEKSIFYKYDIDNLLNKDFNSFISSVIKEPLCNYEVYNDLFKSLNDLRINRYNEIALAVSAPICKDRSILLSKKTNDCTINEIRILLENNKNKINEQRN